MTRVQWLLRGIEIAQTVLQETRTTLARLDEAPEPLVAALDRELTALTDAPGTPASRAALLARCATSPAVFIGDFLTDPAPKQLTLEILATRPQAPLVITALPTSLQGALDNFLGAATDSDRTHLRDVLSGSLPRTAWTSLAPLLEEAHRRGHTVLLADPDQEDLSTRQEALLTRVKELASTPGPVVLTGELRVTDGALQGLPEPLASDSLRVVTDAPGAYFAAIARGEDGRGVGTLHDQLWYAQEQPPLTRLLGFLQWLETGTESCHASAIVRDFPRHAETICSALSLPRCAGPAPTVFAPGDPRYLAAAASSDGTSAQQMEHLAQRFAANDSRYIPGAEIVYIGRPDPAHVAEEAAHFVRSQLGGPGQGASAEDHFWSTTIHEMAGYLGSKVIVPTRTPPVLAPGITPEDFDAEARAHLYGYLMGERLWRLGLENDALRPIIDALFMQDLVEPGAAKGLYFASLNCVAARRPL